MKIASWVKAAFLGALALIAWALAILMGVLAVFSLVLGPVSFVPCVLATLIGALAIQLTAAAYEAVEDHWGNPPNDPHQQHAC